MTQADKTDRLDSRQKNGRISKCDYSTSNPDSINVLRSENLKGNNQLSLCQYLNVIEYKCLEWSNE